VIALMVHVVIVVVVMRLMLGMLRVLHVGGSCHALIESGHSGAAASVIELTGQSGIV